MGSPEISNASSESIAINLALGLLTVIVGASGRFW
jgi:hypothetical protein